MTLVLVMAGSALGSVLRWLVTRFVQARLDPAFPWGTLVVNVTGSFVLGALLAGAAAGRLPATTVALLGAGVCGGFTTFSTFGYETLRLGEDGTSGRLRAAVNVVASVCAGLAAAAAGWALVAALA